MVQRSSREGKGAGREKRGKEQRNRRGGKGCQTFWQKALPRVELGRAQPKTYMGKSVKYCRDARETRQRAEKEACASAEIRERRSSAERRPHSKTINTGLDVVYRSGHVQSTLRRSHSQKSLSPSGVGARRQQPLRASLPHARPPSSA